MPDQFPTLAAGIFSSQINIRSFCEWKTRQCGTYFNTTSYQSSSMSPQERKQQSENRLNDEGIPFITNLPCIEPDSEARLRSPRVVGIRLLCLSCVVDTAFDPSNDAWKRYLQHNEFWDELSPEEQQFISQTSEAKALQLTWRCEAMVPLMWALGLFDELALPRHETNTEAIIERLPALNDPPEPFLKTLALRPTAEILDASDLIYRLHWATRNAALKNVPVPGELNPSVVQEWHHAINWLTCYEDADWDDVSTDT